MVNLSSDWQRTARQAQCERKYKRIYDYVLISMLFDFTICVTEEKLMNQALFLTNSDVADFIDWLVTQLPVSSINVNVKSSKFVPKGINVTVKGFHKLLAHYQWVTSWTDKTTNTSIRSSDWVTTKASIAQMRSRLHSATSDADALIACESIFEWGGERNSAVGARPFLTAKSTANTLLNYLGNCESAMSLSKAHLESLQAVAKMNSMLTKVHAFYATDGLPIYDSRVAGAIAMLVELYRTCTSQKWTTLPALLCFPVCMQKRRMPSTYLSRTLPVPVLTNDEFSSAQWISAKVRLGWVIQAVLAKLATNGQDWFPTESGITGRSHAFEACLFMMGYDLQWAKSFSCETQVEVVHDDSQPMVAETPPQPAFSWVPTVHNFTNVIKHYLNFRLTTPITDSQQAFIQWLLNHNIVNTSNSATAMCFPLTTGEFNLFGCSIDDLKDIASGGMHGLHVAMRYSHFLPNERSMVCLANIYLAGRLSGLSRTNRQANLIEVGYAGRPNSADAIVSVGRSAGRHFGLLYETLPSHPTPEFDLFFSGRYPNIDDDLEV